MKVQSHIIDTLAQGLLLDVTVEDLHFKAYVVISEPDINLVAGFVPEEQFKQEGDVHVAAVGHATEAREQVESLIFNMNLDDAAVFLCTDGATYQAILEELGQESLAH